MIVHAGWLQASLSSLCETHTMWERQVPAIIEHNEPRCRLVLSEGPWCKCNGRWSTSELVDESLALSSSISTAPGPHHHFPRTQQLPHSPATKGLRLLTQALQGLLLIGCPHVKPASKSNSVHYSSLLPKMFTRWCLNSKNYLLDPKFWLCSNWNLK